MNIINFILSKIYLLSFSLSANVSSYSLITTYLSISYNIKHCYSHYGSVCLAGNVVRTADFVSD